MPFYGNSFTFDGQSCRDFGLMMYDFDRKRSDTNKLVSGISVIEDTTDSRWKPFFYGTTVGDKQKFELIFGVNIDRIDAHQYLDRSELQSIAHWLTGHKEYKYLEIEQDDMQYIRYKCIITDLEATEYGMLPFVLKATVECDSPFAYMYPQIFRYDVNVGKTEEKRVQIYNPSGYRGHYYPRITISLPSDHGGFFYITNHSDGDRASKFDGIPSAVSSIVLDNEKNIITWDDSTHPYEKFNCKFFRLVSGNNSIGISGKGTISITCEFPVYVGG